MKEFHKITKDKIDCKDYDVCENCYEKGTFQSCFICQNVERSQHWLVEAHLPDFAIKKQIREKKQISEILWTCYDVYKEYPFFGVRNKSENENWEKAYKWITYGEFGTLVKKITFLLNTFDCLKGKEDDYRKRVAIIGENCPEWVACEQSLLLISQPYAPLNSKLTADEIIYIVDSLKLTALFVEINHLDRIIIIINENINNPKLFSIKLIIVFESNENQSNESIDVHSDYSITINENKIDVIYLNNRLENIKEEDFTYDQLAIPCQDDDLITIIHTSGSTGVPKGAIMTHSFYLSDFIERTLMSPCILFIYAPLSTSASRGNILGGMVNGARYGFASKGDIFEDIRLLRPTILNGVPQIWNDLYKRFEDLLSRRLEEEGRSLSQWDPKDEVVTAVLKKTTKEAYTWLGGRVKVLAVGGALPSAKILGWLSYCYWDTIIRNSYGATECGSIASDGFISDGVEWKLADWNEYKSTDMPYPRGELLVKTSTMISGYWNRPDLNDQIFDDGWYKTGDIVEKLSEKKINVIDRKNNFVKLRNGEFVSVETLENFYSSSIPWIHQIYIYATSKHNFIVAVIVLDKSLFRRWLIENNHIKNNDNINIIDLNNDNSFDEEKIIKDDLLIEKLLSEITKVAISAELKQFEIPKGLLFTFESFNTENLLLTHNGKLSHTKLKEKFSEELNELCTVIEKKISEKSNQLQSQLQLIFEQFKNPNNIEDESFHKPLIEMGIDSLSWAKLSSIIQQNYNVIPPIKLLYERLSLSEVISFAQQCKSLPSNLYNTPQKQLVSKEELIRDSDLLKLVNNSDLEVKSVFKKISIEDRNKIYSINNKEMKGNILLSGATGYLGSFLLFDILHTYKNVQSIYCIARNVSSKEEALIKLKQNINTLKIQYDDPNLLEKIKIIIGDLSIHQFGLSNEKFKSLAQKIDLIYHNGASVNSFLPYRQIRSTNIDSTFELLRLSFINKVKPFYYISTIGVFGSNNSLDFINENSLPDVLLLLNTSSYDQSKWVAENLVLKAFELYNLPVVIHRPALISFHSKSGVSNDTDWFTRLIKGCYQLQIIPDVDNSLGMIELCPVDIVSSSIVSISSSFQPSKKSDDHLPIFHHLNPQNGVFFYSHIFSLLQQFAEKMDHPIELLKFDDWKERIQNLEDLQCDLYPVRSMFSHSLPITQYANLDTVHQKSLDSNRQLRDLQNISLPFELFFSCLLHTSPK